MDYRRNRRIDEILLMMDELMQSIAIEGDLLAEAADNDAEEKAEAANKAEKYDHPQLADVGSAKGNSLRDIIDDDVKRMRVVRWEVLLFHWVQPDLKSFPVFQAVSAEDAS